MSIFEYGVLPEQHAAKGYLELAKPGELPPLAVGVPLAASPNRLLAVCCTQPYEQFPSRVTLVLPEPRRVEKLYLLTANLVKTLKCYYPCAEVVFRYADGSRHTRQMIPPYTMPCVISHFCPRAYAAPIGRLVGNGGPVLDPQGYLSLTDAVVDSSQPLASIEMRCVATECLLGVVAVTLLEAL
jgi:hypothetical protein